MGRHRGRYGDLREHSRRPGPHPRLQAGTQPVQGDVRPLRDRADPEQGRDQEDRGVAKNKIWPKYSLRYGQGPQHLPQHVQEQGGAPH